MLHFFVVSKIIIDVATKKPYFVSTLLPHFKTKGAKMTTRTKWSKMQVKKNDIVSFEDADVNGKITLLSGKVSHISMGIVYVERCGKIYHCKVDTNKYSHCYNIPSIAN